MAEPLTRVPARAVASSLERERADLARLVETMGAPARDAVAALAARLDTPAGRRGVETLSWLVRLVVTLPPEMVAGLARGLAAANGALSDSSPPTVAELIRLARSPGVRRGVKAILSIVHELGTAEAARRL
ncbi:putative chromosome segregation protein [Acidimicrobium ferrooxidans DSM 10331]|uniref:Putative chromosome segregation protein n=1 Tax=Acidimicrobium ferrooxidans (strain DSM 10331 / JCM 15462 / NBRC 103882 / ICP) TaxID=525909 RepID=C7LYG0_ACIFD|nr:hypothetical protein [Acidimicrobium ferrooxidans]ACU53768.1 putative chromosome segregation protein [Acidimicrobium ferrooxidans DSM 10331]